MKLRFAEHITAMNDFKPKQYTGLRRNNGNWISWEIHDDVVWTGNPADLLVRANWIIS
jgi:hypothetical protein